MTAINSRCAWKGPVDFSGTSEEVRPTGHIYVNTFVVVVVVVVAIVVLQLEVGVDLA